MRHLLSRLAEGMGRGQPAPAILPNTAEACFPPPAPARPLAVVGDVHGMARLFTRMLERLAQEAPQAEVISVGDLIDRGDESAQTLRAAHAARHRLTVLRGNHEEMLLRFLDAPAQEGPRWLRNGGLQTLASFGIGGLSQSSQGERLERAACALRAALGPEVEAWLRGLPRSHRNGNIVVTHAGADPHAPIWQQSAQALTWGHPDFGRHSRTDGVWVAHGHTIVPEPICRNGVISVDTGAYAGGGLSAALMTAEAVHFLRVRR